MKTKIIDLFRIPQSVAGGPILAAIVCLALCVPAVCSGMVAITFTIQQGNLQTNGVAYGSGSGYSGALDGQISDNSATAVLTTSATSTLGNAFQSGPVCKLLWIRRIHRCFIG